MPIPSDTPRHGVVVEMKHSDPPNEVVLEAGSLAGIVTSFGLFYPAFFVPGWALLAAPASALLVGSLLYGTR